MFIYLSIYYQVGESCYTFTFYRSITFKEAETFCNVGCPLTAAAAPSTVQVSGGGLAVLDTEEERAWLRRHLVKHVASNICGCQGNCYTDCNT